MSTNQGSIQQAIKDRQHLLALNGLLGLIKEKPTVSNFVYVAQMMRKLPCDQLGYHYVKVAFSRSFTIEPLVPYLEVRGLQEGMFLDLFVGGCNSFHQEILDKSSALYGFGPDVIVLAIGPQAVCPALLDAFQDLSRQQVESEIKRALRTVDSLLRTCRQNSDASIILHNFELPAFPDLGILDNLQELGQCKALRCINEGLADIVRKFPFVYVLDYDHLVSRHGRLNWQDDKMWFTAGVPIAREYLLPLAHEYIRFLKSINGLSRKCLVLDLDNTLWGGIVGEDGFDGIRLGPEYPGNVFLQFQKEIKKLTHRGIILGICSKNNETDALEVIERHPQMVLRRDDFTIMKINWGDKVTSLREIAQELNIGLDSMVYIDDSPVEREWVRRELPEVLTVDLPSDPALFCRILHELDVFERACISVEDQARTQIYRAQVKRKQLEQESDSLEAFYRHLEMAATISEADAFSIPRLAQLTQRTNQFNLTTRRYTESQIQDFSNSCDVLVPYLKLKDRFGDNGIVAMAIIKENGTKWDIDTFLVSCRVVKRGVETGLLAHIVELAKVNGARRLGGTYIPKKKNTLVKDFYSDHNFELVHTDAEGEHWELDLKQNKIEFPNWIKLDHRDTLQREASNA